ALTDEFHQSFVAGRHPSMVDVFLFDGGGAMLALWIGRRRLESKI
ncbi:MAG: VanZ family protein, partial [Chloroflexi bacterium]|nr:VanZ family protein [Chloroflexota bacterium]